jgi:hypothetical protein
MFDVIVRADQTLLLSGASSNEQATSRCRSCYAQLDFSATVALVLAMCGRIAQVSGHTWLQTMGTSAPPTWKMIQQKMLLQRTAMSLVARTRQLLGASSCIEYSACSYNNQRSFNAIIYSRLSSSSTIDEHVSSLMEVAAIIW